MLLQANTSELLFKELESHVFQHALFKDSSGNVLDSYGKDEIMRHWNKFHNLTQDYYTKREKELRNSSIKSFTINLLLAICVIETITLGYLGYVFNFF
jgi:hypothetical protein